MNSILYFNPYAGVSGDMFCGALIDAGADFSIIEGTVNALKLPNVSIKAEKIVKDGISATKFTVLDGAVVADDHHHEHAHGHRHLSDINDLLENGITDTAILADCKEIFYTLAKAEAKVHGATPENIHFHEVGAIDSIVDIVAGVTAIHTLKPEKIFSAPVNTGSGTVKCAHGILPVPAPATAELLAGAQSYSDGTAGELATPTGVALLTYFTDEFQPMPTGALQNTGYGAGTKTFAIPNLFRVMILNRI